MAAGAYGYNPTLWMQGNPNYYGMPQSPGYNPSYSSWMDLTPQVDARLNAIDTKGLASAVDAFRNEAMRQGPSGWAKLAQQEQDLLAAQARDRGAQVSRGQTAQALSDLASSGGLSSGARERTAQAGAKNYIDMSQGVSRDSNLNKMQIGINDEKNRVQQLSMLPGMEQQALAPLFQKQSIWQQAANQNQQNVIAANKEANAFNQNLYNQQVNAWAADRQAKATENSGKK